MEFAEVAGEAAAERVGLDGCDVEAGVEGDVSKVDAHGVGDPFETFGVRDSAAFADVDDDGPGLVDGEVVEQRPAGGDGNVHEGGDMRFEGFHGAGDLPVGGVGP